MSSRQNPALNECPLKPTVVFLDGEFPILSALQSLLRREPYAIKAFSAGADALEYLTTHQPEVIVADIRMPEMMGTDFLQRVRAVCPDATRILMSGYEEKQIILDALSDGVAHSYLVKPWEDRQLKDVIRTALERQKEMRALNLQEILERAWVAAVRRSSLARRVSMRFPAFKDHHILTVSAMLLDIGYLLRFCHQQQMYYDMLTVRIHENVSMIEADRRIFGITHDYLGAALLRHWNFPPRIVGVVAHHHGPTGEDPLLQIVQIADMLKDPDSPEPHDMAVANAVTLWRTMLSGEISIL
jgi:CheY-like chemotaxis protein